MSPEQMQALQYLASLPLQAILLIAVVQLWKALREEQKSRVDDLKMSYEKNLADLRVRVMLLEDKAGIAPQIDNKAHSNDFAD